MLERRGLLLHPWQSSAANLAVRECNVTDAFSEEALGVVRQSCVPVWSLMPFWTQRTFQVYEHPDESLVLTMFAPGAFWQPWNIYDAEENQIAGIRGSVLFDYLGRFSGFVESRNSSMQRIILTRERYELAEWSGSENETRLLFRESTDEDPFLRMAILGMTLVLAERYNKQPGNRSSID